MPQDLTALGTLGTSILALRIGTGGAAVVKPFHMALGQCRSAKAAAVEEEKNTEGAAHVHK